jgi:molybdopterin converting factor subunit 1
MATTIETLTVEVLYFAIFREQAGRDDETVQTTAATARELYHELKTRHGFTMRVEHVRVAVNDEMADWDLPLNRADTLVFIPPVAGG